jgi:hypothetical protein
MPAPPGRFVGAAGGFLLALVLTAPTAAAAERMIDVQGRITDEGGRGAPGQSVRLFKTRRQISLGRMQSGGQVAEAARVTTDAEGFYHLTIPRDRSFDAYFLRFFDPNAFDSVEYRLPPDREITHDLKHRGTLRVDVTLELNPSWAEVSRRIEALGAESPKGKILRALGPPEREGPGAGPDGPREEWWYYERGVVYFFRDGTPAGSRRFDPVTPRTREPQAASTGGGR